MKEGVEENKPVFPQLMKDANRLVMIDLVKRAITADGVMDDEVSCIVDNGKTTKIIFAIEADNARLIELRGRYY